MNPYDFVRIDWQNPPERHRPVWHHRLVGDNNQTLHSGHIEVDVITETPLFIFDPKTKDDAHNADNPATSLRNTQGKYIIPGSSLKGMLRCLVETLGNGCLTLFDGTYEPRRVQQPPQHPGGRPQWVTQYNVHYEHKIESGFRRCDNHNKLCIACRTFGMLSSTGQGGVFLGKVNISDAVESSVSDYALGSIYTPILSGPKPRHAAFYLEQVGDKEYIAGRKYYFHHPNKELADEGELKLSRHGEYMNQHILPIDYDSRFHFRIDFTNLEADEFAALMLAIALEEGMRHKIGYGKPVGLGSIYLVPTSLTLVDYSIRYTHPGVERGKTVLQGDAMWNVLYEHFDNFSQKQLVQIAMVDLRRIWRWPPNPDADYYYPSKRDWFDTPASRGKRIADTWDVPG